MINFKVDTNKCIKCGLCSADCPTLIINNKTEFPTIKEGKEGNCLRCQHCLAICPTGAISILGKVPENSLLSSDVIPKPDEMERLIKTRRSIRKFKKEDVDKALIHELVTTASYAPTAKNDNAVLFTVVDNREEMNKLRKLVYNHVKEACENQKVPESLLYFNNFQEMWFNKGIDIIFRDAPHMLITSASKDCSSPQTDSCIAMSYFELLANSHGFGTLWDGFALYMLNSIAPEVKQIIGIPEDHVVEAALIFGKPARKYARAIQNEDVKINPVLL